MPRVILVAAALTLAIAEHADESALLAALEDARAEESRLVKQLEQTRLKIESLTHQISELASPSSYPIKTRSVSSTKLRATPAFDAEAIAKLAYGDEIELIRFVEAPWVEIRHGGLTGYANMTALDKNDPAIARVPRKSRGERADQGGASARE